MRIGMSFLFLSLLACGCTTAIGAESKPSSASRVKPAPTVVTTPVTVAGVTVQMISATLAEDCGGTGAPYTPPVPGPAPKEKASSEAPGLVNQSQSGERACQQTSMQFSVTAKTLTAPAEIHVKKVEIFDSAGKSVGVLTSRSPLKWSEKESVYGPWDEKVAAGQKLSVSWALSAPNWGPVPGRWGEVFLIKATLSVGGKDTTLQRTVETEAETRLPPGAVT